MHRVLMITVVAAVYVAAQSPLSGRWAGKTPNGFQMALDLNATDKAVTGTFTRNGEELPIANGKIAEGRVTFTVSLNGKTLDFTGEHRGDEVRLWMNAQGASSAAILHRVMNTKGVGQFAGRWQGTTPSGRPLELHLEPAGTGSITLMKQPAKIVESKIEGEVLSFTAGALEGRPIVAKARLMGADLELTVEGVGSPIILKRSK